MKIFLAAICMLTAFQIFTFGQKTEISTREMDRINWMEFKDFVPSKINTVLLPTGTLEPHGVINNGADNTAPFAMAKTISAAHECDDRADSALRNHGFDGSVSGRISNYRSGVSPVRQTDSRRSGEKRFQKYHYFKRSRRRTNCRSSIGRGGSCGREEKFEHVSYKLVVVRLRRNKGSFRRRRRTRRT